MNVTIEINRMRIFARHGVMKQERLVGNDFEVTVHISYPAPSGDNPATTISYADVALTIKRVMSQPAALLETAVARLRTRLIAEHPGIVGGYIKVAKLTPPIPGTEMESAAVSISW